MSLAVGGAGEVAREVGVVAASLAVAAAVLLPGGRARAVGVLAVLALAPTLLAAEVWSTPPVLLLRQSPLLAVAALAVAGAAVAALAAVFVRRPGAFAPLAVAALPFRVPVAAGGQTANLLVPLYLVVGAGGLAYAWTRLRPGARELPEERRAGLVEIALVGSVLLYALQASYSTDFSQALENVVFFYLPFALMLALLAALEWTPGLLRRCLGVLVGLAVAFVLIGFVEYGTGTVLLNPKVIASNQFESFFRVNSLFFDPSIYGRFLALVMLAVSGVLLWSTRTRDTLMAASLLALLWGGLVLTFSQSSFAALLVGLAVLATLRWGLRPVSVAVAAAVVAGVLLIVLAPGLLRVDLGSERSLDQATSGRFELMAGGLGLWAERPVLGHGSGSFSERFRARREASSQTAVAASHTIPITVAVEQGLPGLAAYLAVLATAAMALGRGLAHPPGREPPGAMVVARRVLAAGFAALVLHTLLYAAFLEDPLAWALLGTALGLAALSARPGAGAESLPAGGPSGAEQPFAAPAGARTRTASSSR